jgi:acyl-CoA thioesterase
MTERVVLPDPQVPRTWRQQMALKQIDATTFKSTMGAPGGVTMMKNGEERPRAFGGHVYAQAVFAASKTVNPEFMVHVSISDQTLTARSNMVIERDWIFLRAGTCR